MTNQLLASKIVILEEEPSIPAISALPSAVCLALGICERGPIADRTLVTSFEEYVRYFGGFTTDADCAIAAYGFFHNGGSFMWVSRTVHFTDLTDPATYTAVQGSVMLQTSGTAASPAIVAGTGVQTFNLSDGDTFQIDVNGGGVAPAGAIASTPGQITDTVTYPIAALVAQTMGITIAGANGGDEQTITAAGGETTALDVADLISGQIEGAQVAVVGGQVQVTTDVNGTLASIQVTTPGTLNAILGFPTAASTGTGNVADDDVITGAEIEAIVEAAVATINVVVMGGGTLDFRTVATGATATIKVDATTSAAILSEIGLDTSLHTGADATPENTLQVQGKTPGAFSANITIAVVAASSGVAGEFNLQVLVSGVVKEVFPNVTMGDGVTPDLTMVNYIETVVNDVNLGSNLVVVTDQLLAYTAVNKRPVNGTSAAMTGGDDGLIGIVDGDYIGNQAGPTGLYCFDQVSSGRILIVPGQYTSAILLGMIDYAETQRDGSIFCVLDCPPQYTAAQMVAWMGSSGLTEISEFGAIYWPRIKVANPNTTVFGTDSSIAVPPSGFVAGKYARNDQNYGGVYEQPAGIGHNYGIIRGLVGVEDDPSGGSEHEVLEEVKRDLIKPQRINPITRLEGTPWHIDGGDCLKSTGNFPHIGERRGVIFIEQSIKAGLVVLKHRFNNAENRALANRIITAFLLGELAKDAFRSRNPAQAFYVDTSDALNPVSEQFAGRMNIRIGLATNKPATWIIVRVTQDTRALQEELAGA
jgi:hypothetical protein